jgi:nucleoside-diphosphate-sugar epimerase
MGFRVTALGPHQAIGPWERFVTSDIRHPLAAGALAGQQVVFHLAGKVHALTEVAQDELEYSKVNTTGTQNILEAAKEAGVRRFVFFSSVKAMSGGGERLGNKKAGIGITQTLEYRQRAENDAVEPDTPYGRSKLEAERLVLQGGYVPEPVVLRLCMVYGAGAKGNVLRMLNAVSRKRFPPLPEVGNRRSMVHSQDVVQAAILAAEKPEAAGQVFIVSDGGAYSTRQIYEWMCRSLNHTCPRWSVPFWCLQGLAFAGDVIGRICGRRFMFDSDALGKLLGSAWFDSRKIESVLGFRPKWDLERAMPQMVTELRNRRNDGEG